MEQLNDRNRSKRDCQLQDFTRLQTVALFQYIIHRILPLGNHRIRIKVLQENGGNAVGDMRHLHRILRFYFGDPYMTYIAGRKVPRAYRVRPGYYIKRHRPMTLTLYAEYVDGVLNP